MSRKTLRFACLVLGVAGPFVLAVARAEDSKETIIQDALEAAPASIAEGATVKDLEGHTLREGSNGWTCYPGPKLNQGKDSMCHDAVWNEWMKAWMAKSDFRADRVGFSYMLAGDSGASNIDPYASGPSADNDWVVEGPHVMILVPERAMLEGISTDPRNGGPYVMWKGTPYEHIMWPVGSR